MPPFFKPVAFIRAFRELPSYPCWLKIGAAASTIRLRVTSPLVINFTNAAGPGLSQPGAFWPFDAFWDQMVSESTTLPETPSQFATDRSRLPSNCAEGLKNRHPNPNRAECKNLGGQPGLESHSLGADGRSSRIFCGHSPPDQSRRRNHQCARLFAVEAGPEQPGFESGEPFPELGRKLRIAFITTGGRTPGSVPSNESRICNRRDFTATQRQAQRVD